MEETEATAVVEAPEQAQGTQESGNDQASAKEGSEDSFSTLNPDELSDELKTVYKQLQGDYTRKTQELSEVRTKATAFDDLMKNQGLAEMMENISKYGTPVAPTPAPSAPEMTGEELLLKILEDPKFLKNMMAEVAEEKARTYVEPITMREAQKEADSTISSLQTKYSDFDRYMEQIADMVEATNGSLDPESAYKILTYDAVRSKGVEEGSRITQTRVNGASPRGSSVPVATTEKISSIAQAFAAAKKAAGG